MTAGCWWLKAAWFCLPPSVWFMEWTCLNLHTFIMVLFQQRPRSRSVRLLHGRMLCKAPQSLHYNHRSKGVVSQSVQDLAEVKKLNKNKKFLQHRWIEINSQRKTTATYLKMPLGVWQPRRETCNKLMFERLKRDYHVTEALISAALSNKGAEWRRNK